MIDVAAINGRATLDVLPSLGLRLGRPSGSNVKFCCPSHDDSKPSASATMRNGRLEWHCFPCGAGGDFVSLVAAVHGLDVRSQFKEAAERAAGVVGLATEVGNSHVAKTSTKTRKREIPVPSRPPLNLASELAAVFRPADEDPEVLVYCNARLLPASAFFALDVTELRYLIDERLALGGDPRSSELGRAGLVGVRSDGRLFPAWADNRLCIPWRRPDGELDTIQRRAVTPQERNGPKYIFPPGRAPLWPFGAELLGTKQEENVVVLTEGALDAIARRKLGAGLVLGVPGVDGWRDEWASLVKGRTVRIGFDGDAAGDAGAEKLAPKLWAAGAVRVVRERPEGDWCEQLRAKGNGITVSLAGAA